MIVTDKDSRQRAIALVQRIRAEHCPVEVIVRPHDPKRTSRQNSRHWDLINAIAKFWPSVSNGEWFAPEVWHDYFARLFLGVEEFTIGEHTITRPVPTKGLGKRGFQDLDAEIESYMAVEYGFEWSDK